MGERRTAHTVRSRRAGPTSQLGDAQLQRLIRQSGDSDRAETVVAHEDLEPELELVPHVEPIEPTPPRRFPDSSTVEDVILLTQPRPSPKPGLWLRVVFVMLATAWIAASLAGV